MSSKPPVLVGSHTWWEVNVDPHNIEQLKRSLEFGNVDVDQCLRECIEIGDYNAVCCTLAHWPDTTDCVAKAARANRLDIVQLLVKHGANTSGALMDATIGDSASCIEWLLANGHATDAEVGAAFRRAIECAPIEIVKLFVDAGAQLDLLKGKISQSPLSWAAACGRADVVCYFVDEKRHAVDPFIVQTAVSHGCIDILRFLHERGASVRGTLPLAVNCDESAAKNNSLVELTEFLWECGAKLDFEDRSVFPLVIRAIKLDRPKLARFLLESYIAAPLTEADLIVLATPFARSDLTTRSLAEELWYVTGLANVASPLELAIAGRSDDHVLLVRALLKYGARVDSNKRILFFARWSEPMACLVLAAGALSGVVNVPMIAHDDDWDSFDEFPDGCSAWDPMCFFSGRCYFEAVAALIERGVKITLECVLAAICSNRGYDSVDEALMSLCLLERLPTLSREDIAKVVVAAVCNPLLLQALIDSGFADIKIDKSLAKDLLRAVVRSGNLSRVRWLVDGGLADIKNDRELIMLTNRNDVAVYLLENGVEADDDACEHLVGRHCWDAVCVMLRNGMISLPHKLFALAQGDDRLVRQLTRSLFSCSSHAYSAFAVDNMSLLRACEWGDAQVTELLLRRGVKASFYFLDKSPIHVVRTVECLQLLLAAKADVHAHTLDRETALHCACSVGQRNGVAGDDGVVVALVESRRRASPARRGRVCDDDVVVALIEAGARVNDTDAYGRTALYYAARCGCERAVEALLDAGARVNDLDTNGWSPFHFAAASGNQAVLRALVAAGAVVNARNADGCTPLDVCLQERFSCSTFLYLVDVGCVGSPATMNAALLRVIDIGAKTDVRSVALLLEHGADANARDDRGQSALSIVARGGCRSALLALLCNGALVSRCDQDGKSPLLHAIDNSRYACAVRLVAVGAAIGERESAALVGKDSRWAALAENAKTLDIGGELHRARDGKAALMHTTQNSGAFNLVASAAMRDTSVRYSEDDLLMRFDGAPTIDIGVALHRSRFCFLGLSELSILMQRVTAVRTKRVERNAFVQSLVSDVGSFVCGTGSFATWHAVVAAQAHFIKLETAYDALQERLRAFAASPLDLDVVVSERDNARVTLNAACAQLERCYSAFVANDGRKLTDKLVKSILERLKSLMASEPRYPLAESSDPLAVLTDWSERCTTQMGELRDETEAAACALQGALSRVGDVLSTPAASVYMPSSPTCATLSVAECCAAEEAFLDYCVDQRAARAAFRLAALLREFSAQVGAVEAANSRCRTLSYGWRERGTLELALTPPNADQYRVAMAAALESQETLLKARVQLGSEKKRVALKLHSDSAAAERYEAAAREATALWRSAQRAVEATVVELAQFVFDFPELLVRYGGTVVGLDSFVAAGGDRSVLRTLVEYEERRELVHGRLEAATFRGNPCALKLYQLDASGQARFLREARRLRLLAHANIVEVSAVFVDGSVGVIEMPLYVGDLWQWLALAERSVATRVGVLRQALCGLEHVHRASVVHGDIKPQNILIDGDGTARIGDFDVSQHDVTVLHTTVRGRGFTEAYLAPELVDGTTRASTASDIYAFGVTLLDVLGHERSIRRGRMTRELLASAIEQLAELHIGLPDLLTRLCAEAPRDRPSASEALLIGSFAPHRQPQEDDERLYRCVICCEDFRGSSEGWSCGGGHFYCSADLHGWVDFFCKLPPTEVARHMKLTCSVYECAASWTLTKLAAALQSSPELFSRYVDTLAGAAQCQAANALQVRHKAELDLQERLWRGELDRDEELRVHRRHIEERLLNLQCPRCSAVFGAFDGCFALTCSNCGASICAWCLFDGGADAHAHVFVCERNPRKGEDVFGTEADWEACQRQRRIALVRAYLDTRVRRPEMRAAVLDAVSGSLRNVAIEHVDCQQ